MIPTDPAIEIQEPTGIRRVFSVFAPVKRTEVLTVLILMVNVFVLLTCYYLLKVVREPLILLGGGAELKAYTSAGQTLLLLAVVPAFGWLASRVSRLRLLTTMQVIFIGCLIAFYALAHIEAPIGVAFFLWLGIFNILVTSNFWSFANDLYTEEQGKRLFAVIGIGASIGAIIGAFVPRLLHDTIGMHAMMLVAAGGLALSIVLYRVADLRERRNRRGSRNLGTLGGGRSGKDGKDGKDGARAGDAGAADRKADDTDEDGKALGRQGGFRMVVSDKYLRVLAVMLLVATVINTLGEYVVSKMATEQAEAHAAEVVAAPPAEATPRPAPAAGQAGQPDAEKAAVQQDAAQQDADKDAKEEAKDKYISTFFSDYYTLVNLLSFLLQAAVVARLLTKLGIRRSLFIMPLVALGGWFALALFVNVTMVRVTKTAENSLDYSLHNTLRQALFLPTSREAKYKAKAAIDTFFFRMGDAIAGMGVVFLFVEVFGLGVRAFAILNVVLAACWLLLAARAGKMHDQLAAARDKGGEPASSRAG